MNRKKTTAAVYRVALSAVVIALYFAVMLLTSEFSFGVYQIRIATALYALAMPFPFLVLPLALANMLSNILGGMVYDILGGFLVGFLTAGVIAAGSRLKTKFKVLIAIPAIEFLPALLVPCWLAPILGVPYWMLAASLLVGQLLPAFVGAFLILLLDKKAKALNLNVFGYRGFIAKRETVKTESESQTKTFKTASACDDKNGEIAAEKSESTKPSEEEKQ